MSTTKRLCLIDGTAHAFRAFYAIGELTTSKGIPTNAVYGFTTMLLKILREEEPEYIAVVFDVPGKTVRDEIYEEYKANRPEIDLSFSEQIPLIKLIVDALGVPIFEKEGYEADDVIAMLTKKAETEGFEVDILTNDKDMLQLISHSVRIHRTDREGRVTVYDEAMLTEKFQVKPQQIPDYLALLGDKPDNIPGVAGIGAKSIPILLGQFDTVENIYEKIDEVDKKWKKKLKDGKNDALLGKELTVLITDIPLEVTPEHCKARARDRDKLAELFRELEFKSLMNELKYLISRYVPDKCHTILNEDELNGLLEELASVREFAIDLETTSADVMNAAIVGISISFNPGEAYYIPVYHDYLGKPDMMSEQDVLNKLKPVLESTDYRKIGQNIKFDFKMLKRSGVELTNVYFDTMIASYLLNPSASGHKLSDIAFKYLGAVMTPIEDLIGKGAKQIPMSQVPVERVSEYACADADITFQVKSFLEAELKERDLAEICRAIELPLIPVLADMELTGVKINPDYLAKLSIDFEARLKEMEEKIHSSAGRSFNINSPKQLGEILFDELGLRRGRKTKTGYSTDERTLQSLVSEHPLPALMLEYRHFAKLKSTYVDALAAMINPDTGRVHTSFNQAVTATGRLSSSSPNLQNVPVRTEEGREIRRAFIAPSEDIMILAADYSQIELRILAHLSKDARLVEAFEKGEDIHTYAASLVFGVPIDKVTSDMRRSAKTMNYGIVYGIGARRLASELKISMDEAQTLIDSYFQTYSGVKAYFDQTIEEATEKGYVTTLTGRRRYMPELASKSRNIREFGKRAAINAPVQGSAADLIKIAMLKVDDYLISTNKGAKMLLQVHDELVFETPKAELDEVTEDIRQIMENAMQLDVPIKVDINVGQNWLEAK